MSQGPQSERPATPVNQGGSVQPQHVGGAGAQSGGQTPGTSLPQSTSGLPNLHAEPKLIMESYDDVWKKGSGKQLD